MIDTLDKWRKHEANLLAVNHRWFTDYPLRGMGRLHDGRYQFGYEIAGYGTVIGPCCHHSHKTQEAAEDCGQRFLNGQPPRRWWHRLLPTSPVGQVLTEPQEGR